MFLRIGDQQFGWLKGGFFAVGRTPFRPAIGPYDPEAEVAFLQRYAQQLELEIEDVDKRLAMLHDAKAAPAIEPTTGSVRGRETVSAG